MPGKERVAYLEVCAAKGRLPSSEVCATVAAGRPVVLLFGGPVPPDAVDGACRLHQERADSGQALVVDFLLNDDADASAVLGGLPNPLGPLLASGRALRDAGVRVRWRVPAVEPLAYRLEALFSLALDEGFDSVLVRGRPGGLDAESRRFIEDFLAHRLLDEERSRLSPGRAQWYEVLRAELVTGGPPERATAEQPDGMPIALLEPDEHGEWRLRSEVRDDAGALADIEESGAATPSGTAGTRREPSREVAGVLAEGVRALAQWGFTASRGRWRAAGKPPDRTLPRILVIGAYGGDHIGDTAIVGGVLLRMHRRYGTREAILVSQRPAHTARLAAMLDTPVTVTVREYRQATAGELAATVDGVVFAGGPLMDLPKQLVKHLFTVARARRDGKPFVIEGIGAGPFIRRVSAWTARLLVLMAERVTVRTAADAEQPLMRGLHPHVGRDPAFDYLDTRGPALTRMPDDDRRWLDRLFEGTDGRVTVGINLRPLRPDYTVGTPAAQRAEYTRMVESRFEQRLAEAMRRFARAFAPDAAPCFIFYPMNAIQFGSSDLRSAYRMKRLLGPDVDLRVWEADPSIDGVVELLRRVDAAITMRFHATIYALSQRTPVIGVDYRPGKKDKVAALLADAGQAHNCGRIDEITADWMFERLLEVARLNAGISGMTLPPVPPPVPT